MSMTADRYQILLQPVGSQQQVQASACDAESLITIHFLYHGTPAPCIHVFCVPLFSSGITGDPDTHAIGEGIIPTDVLLQKKEFQ